MKRVVSIQDISCLGKCSLTVALPIISAMGHETVILPTAVLSTHTAFSQFTFRDLTDDITPIAEHWKKEKFVFDAIYTGYLGSFQQIDLMKQFFDDFNTKDNFIFVDPAMADNGKLYTGFTPDFAKHMATLCAKADVIVPNLTEAAFMLDIPYRDDYSEAQIKDILRRLAELGAKRTVLTGVGLQEDSLGVMAFDAEKDDFFYYQRERIPCCFHRTGDVFASTCCGAMACGFSCNDALKVAVDYTVECIKATIKNPEHNWYGVDFETAIPYLIRRIGK